MGKFIRRKRYEVVQAADSMQTAQIIGGFDDFYAASEFMSAKMAETKLKTFVYDRLRGMFFDPDEAYSRSLAHEVNRILRQNTVGDA